jgi:VWFA-related protein
MVYSIRYLSPLTARTNGKFDEYVNWVARGKSDLDRLSRETGGIAFDGRTDELPSIFDRIETDLRSVYVLGYTPSRAPGKRGERKIQVRVTRPGLTVRAQEHYYAQ